MVLSSNVGRWAKKAPVAPSTLSDDQQDNKLEVLESNEEDVCAAVDVPGFNETGYNGIDIWVRIDQILFVQSPLLDNKLPNPAELEASFRIHVVNFKRSLISTTALSLLSSWSTPSSFYILRMRCEWCWAMTAMSESCTGATSPTRYNLSTTSLTGPCRQCLTQSASATSAETMRICCQHVRLLSSATTTAPSPPCLGVTPKLSTWFTAS